MAWISSGTVCGHVRACAACNIAKGYLMPTCTCQFCRSAVISFRNGRRGPVRATIRARLRFRGGIWHVGGGMSGRKADRYTFRTLRRAHEFARERRCELI